MMAKDAELRMAAIAAVMAVTQQGDDPGQVARQAGAAWSQDHRRMLSGQSSLMHARARRSPWR